MGNLKGGSQKHTNMIHEGGPGIPPRTGKSTIGTGNVGRIGVPTPPGRAKGGFTVDNNRKAGPRAELGALAASHMGLSPKGDTWSPRVRTARKQVAPGGGTVGQARGRGWAQNSASPNKLNSVKPGDAARLPLPGKPTRHLQNTKFQSKQVKP